MKYVYAFLAAHFGVNAASSVLGGLYSGFVLVSEASLLTGLIVWLGALLLAAIFLFLGRWFAKSGEVKLQSASAWYFAAWFGIFLAASVTLDLSLYFHAALEGGAWSRAILRLVFAVPILLLMAVGILHALLQVRNGSVAVEQVAHKS